MRPPAETAPIQSKTAHDLPLATRAARKLLTAATSRRYRGRLVDPPNSMNRVTTESDKGIGIIFPFGPHPNQFDGLQLTRTVMHEQPGVGKRVVVNPASMHQNNILFATGAKLAGSPLFSVVSESTLGRPKYREKALKTRPKLHAAMREAAAKALKTGGSVTLSVNPGRSPFLDMDDPQVPLATLMRAMDDEGVETYGIVPIAIYRDDKREYTFTAGEYRTNQELLADPAVNNDYRKADSFVREQIFNMIDEKYKPPPTFASVVVVGAAGQTGRVFTERIARIKDTKLKGVVKEGQIGKVKGKLSQYVEISTDLKTTLEQQPDALILTTQNPITELLQVIVQHATAPLTLILTQNGVGVADQAQETVKDNPNVNIVRGFLFTPISMDEKGRIPETGRPRISLAPVPDEKGEIFSERAQESLMKAQALFQRAGFEVVLVEDHKGIEWTKALANALGSTGAVTGLTPLETFTHPELAKMELRGHHDRIRLVKAAGIQLADIPWTKGMGILRPSLALAPTTRDYIAHRMAEARNNLPPAAARKIEQGKETETEHYHKPFVDLAMSHNMRSPVDMTILRIMRRHNNGKINLRTMSTENKIDLLLKTYQSLI